MAAENFSVREAEALRPRLRDGLGFSIQEQGGRRVCVIEDPAASRFHRVGLAEYRFLRALDGTRPVAGILAQLAREGGEAFTEAEALQMIRWLKDQHLLAVESVRSGPTDREHGERALRLAATWLNPLILKLPLFRPDRFFARLEPLFRPALGGGGFLIWLVVVLAGAAQVTMNWRRFTGDSDGFFARDNWLWIFIAWAGLKVAHEFSHGLFCKRFGGAVREAGVILVVFVPMGYVDATASLGFASRWRRMMVAAAGLYLEFFLAAIAAIVWAQTPPGALHTLAHNMVITGTVLTLFFNANPLMRFDGYYLLSDLLDVPNLATRGRAWAQRALSWLLLGGRAPQALRPASREQWIAALYGVAAWAWQLLTLAGLLLGASVALRGGGLLLAVVAGAAWVGLPLWRFVTSLAGSIRAGTGHWAGLAVRAIALAALVAAAIFVPWHRTVSSTGVLELADTQVLRAECPGFVEKEWVQDGDLVAAGQVLLELRNDEATAELGRRRLALEQQELRARLAYTRDDVAAFQAEQAKSESLRKEVAEREQYLATQQIRAPFAGRVTNRRLGQLGGVFFKPGEEILHLGRADASEVKVAVSERDEPYFRAALGQPLSVRVAGRGTTLPGALARVEARATRELIHPALSALANGPLPVRRSEDAPGPPSAQTPAYELAEPYFTAIVRLPGEAALAPGELARVRFRGQSSVTLWSEMQTVIARWLRRYTARER
ncbi:MAG: putative peptide zinc metalloprotease protein [Chthoniobacter sp.]|jgi:putative peptide zinc metalloprotease protein|nr:putative peptide zinc metalloprotease protein [Chthoniobacter sp.]